MTIDLPSRNPLGVAEWKIILCMQIQNIAHNHPTLSCSAEGAPQFYEDAVPTLEFYSTPKCHVFLDNLTGIGSLFNPNTNTAIIINFAKLNHNLCNLTGSASLFERWLV